VSDVLIDDRLLGAFLRTQRVRGLPRLAALHTTGLWYFRLCRAYFGADAPGALSRPFASLPRSLRLRAESRLLELPEAIGLLDLRSLAVAMARHQREHPTLNLLALEALAAAETLGADVYAGSRSPGLEAALEGAGRRYVVVDVG
jgi:hypothetical protein